jgi:hypothetical protein
MTDIVFSADGSQVLNTLKRIEESVGGLQSKFKQFGDKTSKSLESVKKTTDKLSDSTDKLKEVLLGIGVAKIAGDFLTYAKEVKSASTATGVAINTVNDFAKAVGRAGGDTSRAVGDVIDFTAELNNAKQGSAGAQAELSQLGISLRDLGTLSNEELFKKTIENLAKMEDASMRNALAVKYLGRNFKDIDVKEVYAGMNSGKDNTAAIESAAAAMKNFNIVISGFKQGIISAIQPLTAFVGSLSTDTLKSIGDLAASIATAAAAITAISGVLKVASVVGGIFATQMLLAKTGVLMMATEVAKQSYRFAAAFATMKMAAVAFTGVTTQIAVGTAGAALGMSQMAAVTAVAAGRITGTIATITGPIAAAVFILKNFFLMLWNVVTKFALGMVAAFSKLLGPIALVITAIQVLDIALEAAFDIKLIDTFMSYLKKAYYGVKDFLGLKPDMPDQTDAESKRLKERAEAVKAQEKETQRVVDANRGVVLEAQKTVEAYRQQFVQLKRAEQLSVSMLGLEGESLANAQKMADLETSYLNEKTQLQQKFNDLKRAASGGTVEEQQAFAAFGAVYGKTLKEIDAEYIKQKNDLTQILSTNTLLKAQETERLKVLERRSVLEEAIRAANDKRQDIRFQAKLAGKNPLEGLVLPPLKITADMSEAEREITEANRRVQENALLGPLKITADMSEVEKAAVQSNQRINEFLKTAVHDVQQQFAQIQEEARKAALEAGRAVAAGFSDDGDGLTPERSRELAEGLARIAEQYRGIAREQTVTLMKANEFSTGWSEAFRSYADSATNAANMGRQAFESVASAMTNSIDEFVRTGKFSFGDFAKSVIADLLKMITKQQIFNALKMAGGSDAGGMFSGVGKMLGFAEGGQPPLNKPSIVGENGPELFVPRSAGTVIPNGGFGQPAPQPVVNNITNVTNNVSAIDAAGVAKLFSDNRRTLFGAVSQAEKEMPVRGRAR